MNKLHFAKPPLSLAEQVDLLSARGMNIPDPKKAEDVLLRVNYYRFSGYALHFEIFENRRRTQQITTF